ncbi:3-deoxy-D-manno-octulosonic acid transferase [Polluticaenibacter yanchengensis]|uniref:3-deoxy-D-manno-octulosonic acid transferase n=1 Tax=Polluticaenibacter yanchengensis TaxID=3014562 RepID=A0ABT4UHJ8_9BACT|nr:3-deoxy-D-manno-octulosonic acid transferase [Chitinophagaceae bacterium LY-5]
MSLFLYNLFVHLYKIGAIALQPFNIKARYWLRGRRKWKKKLKKSIEDSGWMQHPDRIWVHVSSLGEFEQGRPIIEALKKTNPDIQVFLTFFSPSGYNIAKKYKLATMVHYLPLDTPQNAKKIISITKPTFVIWVKYDYWYHILTAIHAAKIPLILTSAPIRENQPFFKWYGGLHRKMLSCFNHFFIQTETGANLLKQLVPAEKVSVSGDTRFDRVIDIADQWQPIPIIESWLNGSKEVLVAGSTWSDDEKALLHFIKTNPEKKFILAPHQVEPSIIEETLKLLPDAQLFSQIKDTLVFEKKQVLIIDNIGMLSKLYKYAKVCYVGGGFNSSGIHNLLEAAVYGLPVTHGPVYEKFNEAVGLEDAGGGFPFESAIELEEILNNLFNNADQYSVACAASKNYVFKNAGSTRQIIDYILPHMKNDGVV